MEHQEYPKMLYFKGDVNKQRTVTTAAEEDKLGADWIDAPVDQEQADLIDALASTDQVEARKDGKKK